MYDQANGLFAHMDAAEHVVLHAEGPVVRLQSAETQPNVDPRRQPDGHTLRRRQSFNYGGDRLGLTVLPGASWAPLGQAPGGGSIVQTKEPSAAAALSIPAAAAATVTRAVPAKVLSRAGPSNRSTRTASGQFSVAISRGQKVDSNSVKASSVRQSAVSGSAAAKLVYSLTSESAARKQGRSESKLEGGASSADGAALQEAARQGPEQAKSTEAVRPVSAKVAQKTAQPLHSRQGQALRSNTVRAKPDVSQSRQRRRSGPVKGLQDSTDSDSD